MSIKNYTTGVVPFLEKYDPYQVPENLEAVYSISDMFIYDLVPDKTTRVEYEIGAKSSYVTTMSVKNITTNIPLQVTVSYDNTIFKITNALSGTQNTEGKYSKYSVVVEPNTLTRYVVEINKETLNFLITPSPLQNVIKLQVTNISNNDVIFRNKVIEVLPQITLPELITVE